MPTGNTSLLGLALPVQGELAGTWGDVVNNEITSLVDSAIAGTTTLSADADVTLTTTALAANQARQAVILWTASNGATTRNITAPAQSKAYIVINAGTGSIVLRGAGPTTGVTIVSGERCLAAWNGSDFVKVATTAAGAAAGSNTQVQFNSSGNLAGSANLTFDGSQLDIPLGSAAAPALSTPTDPNTGMFFPAADTIAFAEGGVESMRLDASGNLGIGTTSPGVRLDVRGSSPALQVGQAGNANGGALRWDNASGQVQINTTGDIWPIVFQQNSTERFRFGPAGQLGIGGANYGTAGQVLTSGGSGSPPIWASGGGSQWVTSGSNIYYSTGLVGINQTGFTTSGVNSGQLQVTKPGFASSSSIAYAIAVTGGSGNGLSGTENGGIKIKIDTPNFITTYGIYVDQTSGGTGQSKYAGYFASTSGSSNVSSYGIYSQMAAGTDNGLFATNYSIYSNAIGTATNNVNFAFYAKTDNRANAIGMSIEDSYSVAASKTQISFVRNGSVVGTITNTLSATAYNTSSDYRLKENVQIIQNALDDVMRMRPVTYDWIGRDGNGIGFIAHELQEIVPHAVYGTKDETKFVTKNDEDGKMMVNSDGSPKLFEEPVYQGVDASFVVPHLVKAIQELKAEFDAYKAAHP
jgi:hypothetical protein